MLLAALCSRKPDFPLKELMIAKHSFLSTKLPKIIKLGVFYRSFHPQGCYGIYKLPLLSNTDMRVSLSQLLKKEMSSKERDSSLMALSIPARSSSIRLARTAPGSTRGVVCFGGGRRKHSFLTEKCYSQLKEEKNPNLKWWKDWACCLQQTRQKASQQCTNEEDTVADFYNTCCHSFTSLKLALLVLQSLVSLNSLSLFCFKNVLVKTKTPVSLPWALLPLIGKKHMILALTQSKVTDAAEESTRELPSLLQFKILHPKL